MIHPIDYRYGVDELEEYLSPRALMRYQLQVEVAYVTALNRLGVCPADILQEYVTAESQVSHERVVELEATLKRQ